MTEKGLIQWRKDRLQAAANRAGGKAALGKLLGHSNGAQVGHMLAGRRPVTEKTVQAIEALQGFRGWFSREAAPPQTIFDELTDTERELLENYRAMFDEDQMELAAEIARRAEKANRHAAQVLAKFGVAPKSAAAKRAESAAKATVAAVRTKPAKEREEEPK